jgi:RimJ/RimL family protein N-acetyltransferase
MDVRPVTLEGRHVRLEPLTLGHVGPFREAAREWGLTLEQVREGVEDALRRQSEGTSLPFATIERGSGAVVGGTRFLRITPEHRRLEIGSTWVAAPWRRTAVNTEAKLLMLEHAFERLGCVRVEFLVDALNETSRKAVLRIGAAEEGTLRSYVVTREGEARDAVIYSIVAREWPALKTRLREMLSRPRAGGL